MNNLKRACTALKCTMYDLIKQATEYLEEDIRDATDVDGLFKAYVEHGTVPLFVHEYADTVNKIAKSFAVKVP